MIDPNKLKFGSKISTSDVGNTQKENYYSVKSILDTNLLELNTGIGVRLLGVKIKREKLKEAIEFLKRKIGKGLIYLRFDTVTYNELGGKTAWDR